MKDPILLFELGTTSLKLHRRPAAGGKGDALKVPWSIGHEVCRDGEIHPRSIDGAAAAISILLREVAEGREPARILAFATGVFREARNLSDFVIRVWARTGVKVWVISGDQEAALLQSVFLGRRPPPRSLAFDLGSGSLQWALSSLEGREGRGSIPMGVIRLYQASGGQDFHLERAQRLATRSLERLPRVNPGVVVASGGAVKSIVRALGGGPARREAIADLRERVLREGPPPGTKPHRAPLFLPGVVMVERILHELGAEEVRHEDLSVGEALLAKALPFYRERRPVRPTLVMRKIRFSEILTASRAGSKGEDVQNAASIVP